MLGSSYLKKRLLRSARKNYNSGKFKSSRRISGALNILYRDRESLDIFARSNLRLKKYENAKKAYSKANKYGYSLLDHEVNSFEASLGAEDYVEAFRAFLTIKVKKNRKDSLLKLVKRLEKLTDTERVECINEMNEISTLPTEVSKLLPWSPKRVNRSEGIPEKHSPSINGNISSQRLQREIVRIRSSGAYRLSEHISKSVRRPLKLLFLPISTPFLAWKIYRERKGKFSQSDNPRYVDNSSLSPRDCIIFFPTNGVGFGHFTRLLAIAKRYRKISPNTEIVFFTTMPTLHILSEEGFVSYHISGRYRYQNLDAKNWNSLCEEMLNLIFNLHRPKCFVFDGSFPYRGMLNAIKSQPNHMRKIWVRRGAIKKGSKRIPVDSINHFDAIVRPGDSVQDNLKDETRNNLPILKTQPILLENDFIPNGQGSLRHKLGVPKEAILCYIQLGAGQINQIDSELEYTLDALQEHPQTYVVVGESMLGNRLSTTRERVRVLRDYPNSMFFHEFDFAVIAGGYNSYHEVISSGLPSICYPNYSTGRDDQLSRAMFAVDKGAMIVLKKRNPEKIRVAISRIMDSSNRANLKRNMSELSSQNGVIEAAEWIKSQIL